MKRSVAQLHASLKRGLAPIYLVTGDEPLQRMECTDAIRVAARAQGFDERIVLDSGAGVDWSALRFEADNLSLFSSRRLIEIRLSDAKVGTEGAEALRDYCARPSQDTLLLISAPKFDGRSQQSEWFKSVDKVGEVVQVWPVKAEEMPQWIAKRLAGRGLLATPEALRLLADRVEGNLLAAAQDIDKLALFTSGKTLNVDDVIAAVGDSARFDLFALADTALNGDAARAVRMLRGLQDEGAEPVLVCWVLTRGLRAACLVAAGAQPAAAIPGYRSLPQRETLLKSAAKRLGTGTLRMLLRQASYTDRIVKGAATGEPWSELTTLCLRLAGKPWGE